MNSSSLKSSVDLSCSNISVQLLDILHSAEAALGSEQSRFEKCVQLARALEQQVEWLSKDFAKSESKFYSSKSFLEKLSHKIPSTSPMLENLCGMLKVPPEKSPHSLQTFLANFHYKHLSDERVEKMLPIWKNDKGIYKGHSAEMFEFISLSVESKMKSDLLNVAGDKLIRAVNRMEAQKIKVQEIKDKVGRIKEYLSSVTKDDLDQSGIDIDDLQYYFQGKHQEFAIQSDELYGTLDDRGNVSTIIYSNREPNCPSCFCINF
jgi:hypothetical protein